MFPLCQRPGSVALLDDDPMFLEVLQEALSGRWAVSTFEDADVFRSHLEADAPFWEVDVWLQQEAVARWRARTSSLAKGVLDYWRRQTERYACTRVCLIDYKLQDRTGLDVLRNLGAWQGRKVLVTGCPSKAVRDAAFDSGLIDGFFSKAFARLLPQMFKLIDQFQKETDPRLEQLWRSTLSESQVLALGKAGVAQDLARMIGPDFVEHVVLAEPFGVLCLRGDGSLGWLPLTLRRPAEALTDRALRAALDLPAEGYSEADAMPLGAGAAVYGAFFEVATDRDFELPGGYDRWLRQQRSTARHRVAQRADARASGRGRARGHIEAAVGAAVAAFTFEPGARTGWRAA